VTASAPPRGAIHITAKVELRFWDRLFTPNQFPQEFASPPAKFQRGFVPESGTQRPLSLHPQLLQFTCRSLSDVEAVVIKVTEQPTDLPRISGEGGRPQMFSHPRFGLPPGRSPGEDSLKRPAAVFAGQVAPKPVQLLGLQHLARYFPRRDDSPYLPQQHRRVRAARCRCYRMGPAHARHVTPSVLRMRPSARRASGPPQGLRPGPSPLGVGTSPYGPAARQRWAPGAKGLGGRGPEPAEDRRPLGFPAYRAAAHCRLRNRVILQGLPGEEDPRTLSSPFF
jgi:hypothetical protein